MTEHPPRPGSIWIEIAGTQPTMHGVVHYGDGTQLIFEGWLELVSALAAHEPPTPQITS